MGGTIGGQMFDQIRVDAFHGLLRRDLVLVDLLLEHVFFDHFDGNHPAPGSPGQAQGLVQRGNRCLRKIHPHHNCLECLHLHYPPRSTS